MTALARLIPDNPVLTKELRVRMRGARAYWMLLGYLGFIAVLVLMKYWRFTQDVAVSGSGGSNSAALGYDLFLWIMVPQVFLVLFITPAITSGTLTIEREQQTMDMLTLTRLSRRSIVTGKLLSAVSFTALLIISSLPLLSICFMLGGIDPGIVFSAYLEMLAASVLIGAMGMMWSSICRTTTQAVLMTYTTLFIVFGFGSVVFSDRLSPFNGSAAATSLRVVGDVWFGGSFLGIKVPEGSGFAIICLLGGILMTAVSTVRIEMLPHRKAYILRGLMLLMLGVLFLALDVSWTSAWYARGSAAVAVAVQPPIGVLILSAVALMLITPIFATGEIASFEARRFVRRLLWGCTPDGLKRGKLVSGIQFLMLAVALSLGMYALSFMFAGHRTGVVKSGALALGLPGLPPPDPVHIRGKQGETVTVSGGTVTVSQQSGAVISACKLPNGLVQVNTYNMMGQSSVVMQASWPTSVPPLPPPPPARNIVTPQTGDFAQGAVMLFVSIAGFGLVCMLLSMMFKSRIVAVILAYIFLLILFILPEIAKGMSDYGTGGALGAAVNLFYLNPVQAFLQMCEPATYWQSRLLIFGQTPMWQVVTEAWALIGGLTCLAMVPFIIRLARENAPIPYEEQVALA